MRIDSGTQALFLHGAGRSGAAAWPVQAQRGTSRWVFFERSGVADSPERDCEVILDALDGEAPIDLVAHSAGAVTALLIARRAPSCVRTLTLFEPASFDLAPDRVAVREHIAAMAPVFAVADDPDVSAREFSRRFSEAMGREPVDLPDDVLEENVRRLRAMPPPWGYDLLPGTSLQMPTLVLTAGTDELYEQTARALVGLGAVHERLGGSGHRVQDHPRATARMQEHWCGGAAGSGR